MEIFGFLTIYFIHLLGHKFLNPKKAANGCMTIAMLVLSDLKWHLMIETLC